MSGRGVPSAGESFRRPLRLRVWALALAGVYLFLAARLDGLCVTAALAFKNAGEGAASACIARRCGCHPEPDCTPACCCYPRGGPPAARTAEEGSRITQAARGACRGERGEEPLRAGNGLAPHVPPDGPVVPFAALPPGGLEAGVDRPSQSHLDPPLKIPRLLRSPLHA